MTGLTQRKAARMEEAAKLKWGEDLTHEEIADELDLAHSTIDQYFSSDHMEKFQRIFTDMGRFELQRVLEQQLYDIEQEAVQKIREAANDPESTASDQIRAGKELMNVVRRKLEMLQQLGVVEKPKERSKVETGADTDELREELVEGLQTKREELMSEE
jgi:DNA-binding transcriptional regulator LsrR (DeoR family)